MDFFQCPSCGGHLFFHNLSCACGTEVAYDPEARRFQSLSAVVPCANRPQIGCNWKASEDGLCRSCSTTRTRPDLSVAGNLRLWAGAEQAKRRVFYDLMHWGLFTPSDRFEAPIFDLLAEETRHGETPVTMGHADGVITINVEEADAAEREARRLVLGEPFRTMVGHFRHEIGHLVFERLKGRSSFLGQFRDLFGDERTDYAAALERHYDRKPPEGWQRNHLSAYATAHPHEDWAESFAHFLHLTALIAAAQSAGVTSPALVDAGETFDVYLANSAEPFLTIGADLSIALNHMTRAVGLPDPYPFVLTSRTREKLAFVQIWLRHAA